MNRRETHAHNRSTGIVRAARRRRRRVTRLSVMFVALLLCISLTGGIVVMAGNIKQPVNAYKYYTAVEIQSGDTLWSIASEYYQQNNCDDIRDYIKELKQLNNMNSDKLIIGDKLVVSYYSTDYK